MLCVCFAVQYSTQSNLDDPSDTDSTVGNRYMSILPRVQQTHLLLQMALNEQTPALMALETVTRRH